MKKIIFIAVFAIFTNLSYAQLATTGKIDSLKDSWDQVTTYTGEIKNGVPNGIGVAYYHNDNVRYYTGHFVNGKYDGQGTILFKNGAFLTGEWKNGKMEGQGVNYTSSGDLFIGKFSKSIKNGDGVYIYNDNGILQGTFKDDKFEGRCVFINSDASIISDVVYANGKKNGSGYQYEVNDKKLYEGVWSNGDWQNSGTASYGSFLKDPGFYGEKTDSHVLMGITNSDNYLNDTGYFYDKENGKRYFGVFRNGYIKKGVTLRNDSTRFFGTLSDDGADGYCYSFKKGKYFDVGNFSNDFLKGPNCLSINLDANTVYYGEVADSGYFTGKAFFTSSAGSMYVGDYKGGKFTGNGYKITVDGFCIRATWNDGYPSNVVSITDDKGNLLNIKPATISEAISNVAKTYKIDFDALYGEESFDFSDDDFDEAYNSNIQFPGGLKTDYIVEDDDYVPTYFAPYIIAKNFASAQTKYNELCKLVSAAKISLQKGSAPLALTGTVKTPVEEQNTLSVFTPVNDSQLKYFQVGVSIKKLYTGEYLVSIMLGDSLGGAFEKAE